MASSNRHWPSMYRSSLACNFQQPQPDMNNGGGGKSLMSSRSEESGRNPEPRPRWNPRPEQIRILEGIFNSGMVNPPRDEIRRIRLQLQEYGPVGDANVFYWFQNRKSRTKHKLRAAGQLQPSGRAALSRACAPPPPALAPAPMTPPRHLLASPVAPTSSSSSSSDRSSGSSKSARTAVLLPPPAAAAIQGVLPATAIDLLSPKPTPALAAHQLYYHSQQLMAPAVPPPMPELITSPEPFLLHWQQQGGHYLPATELGGVLGAHTHEPPPAMHPAVSPSVLLGLCNEALGQDCVDIISSKQQGLGHGQYWNTTCGSDLSSNNKTDAVSDVIRDDEKARLGLLHYGFGAAAAAATSAPLAAPVQPAAADASTAMLLPSSAPSNVAAATSSVLTDQLQGLLDPGLIGGTPLPPPTATVVVVARDAVTCAVTAQFSVPAMRLDVKLAFGDAAVLVRHTGEPVLVDESGVTVEPLQQDTLYYLLMVTH
ncbi:hypothetical protein SETIT_3G145800v2 [Setaria italica]|uniref:Homeobox domain-containing protein n=1 Tax=Setaria italica TaxID=4555 RepID=A0A368QEX0_SETIT|nr:WUSCHEL-related homeobox 12 [Setaria italica]RCV16535.1 hypothetical protein SETIT_3G145800v2 [Setaria italica]